MELFEEVEGIVLEVKLDGETVWLSQQQLAELFERDQSVISRHINRIFKDGELAAESNMQKVHIAHSEARFVLQLGCNHFSWVSGKFS